MQLLSIYLSFLLTNFGFYLVTSIYNPYRYVSKSLKLKQSLHPTMILGSKENKLKFLKDTIITFQDQSYRIIDGQEFYISPAEIVLVVEQLRLSRNMNVYAPNPLERFFTFIAKVFVFCYFVILLSFAKFAAQLVMVLFGWIPLFNGFGKKLLKVIDDIFIVFRVNDLLFDYRR